MKKIDLKCITCNGTMLFESTPSFLLSNTFRLLLFMLVSLMAAAPLSAQAPESFSYQAVVRDLSNNLVTGTTVGVQITLRQDDASGSNVFRETHTPVTNGAGLISLEIGTGTNVNGSLTAIDWEAGPYFIQQEIDPTGGTNYTIDGTTQLLSVPYSLYAANSGRAKTAEVADQANALSAGAAGAISVPIGTILPYAGPAGSVPSGWLLCDGASYEANAYPLLEDLLRKPGGGYLYGSQSGQFKVPDLRGRVPVGYDVTQTEFGELGENGGEKEVTLEIDEMPTHKHSATTATSGEHRHKIKGDNGGGGSFGFAEMLTEDTIGECNGCIANFEFDTNFDGGHSHDIAVQSTGGSNPHNNLQPYLTINFIIKAR